MKRIIKNLVALLGLLPSAAVAEEVQVVYLTATMTDGTTVETRLTDIDDLTVPRLNTANNTFRMKSVVYQRDAVVSLRYDVRTEEETGIVSVNADGNASDGGNIYSISGRLVRSGSTSVEGLPKGVYIVNNKKIIVR